MTKKNTETSKRYNGPIRLNLNLRTRTNAKNAPWKHYQGLSFICEAANEKQAAEFATLLKAEAQKIAIRMGLIIPGAIYIKSQIEASDGVEERTTEANPA